MESPMNRRTVLALVAGGITATAGCLSSSDEDEPASSPTSTDTATSTPTTEPATVESISSTALQPARIELGSPDSIGVFREDEGQSLYVSVAVGEENPPERSAFSFEFDGGSVNPVSKTRNIWRRSEAEFDSEYTKSDGGWLLFDLPTRIQNPETAQLTWPGGSWQPPEGIRTRLADPNPTFEASLDAPETAHVDESPEATVTFENTSSVPGTFLMAVNRVGPYIAYAPEAAVRRLLQPGESATATITASVSRREEITAGDTTELKFDWLGGEADREIEFVDES